MTDGASIARVLVVDDEPGIRDALTQVLEYEKYEVHSAGSGNESLRLYPEVRPELVLLDVKMEGLDGLDTLARLRELDPTAYVIMISGHGTIQTAVEATQRGAFDFLEKPLDTDRMLVSLRNALAHRRLVRENVALREATGGEQEFVGASRAIRDVLAMIDKVGATDSRVLVTGENGTGKELVARAIHRRSRRSQGPFVEVNCAAIPTELIESELFGHIKGSFTGAVADRAGKFEQADGGTLFLDEVGDMSAAAQAKVLRALEEGVVTRVGGSKPIAVDVRVVAATNQDLEAGIREGRFREDLYYRLNVVPIRLPPLGERRDDIPLLVAHFVGLVSARAGVAARGFDDAAVARLRQRDWPGNVRELRNTVERLLILAGGPTVSVDEVDRLAPPHDDVSARGAAFLGCETFEEFKQEAERAFLEAKLEDHDWNVSETARKLGMPRSNLYKKIEKYGLTRR
jgi:two-component system nitrogen regulation response regulator NtrX